MTWNGEGTISIPRTVTVMWLVVSSNRARLSNIGSQLRSRTNASVVVVDRCEAATRLLEINAVEVVVVDLHHCDRGWLAGLGGLFPEVRCVAVGARVEAEVALACLPPGATLRVDPIDWDELVARLEVELNAGADILTGVAAVGLEDVLNLLCMTRSSAEVEVVSGPHRGTLWLEDGQVIHAERGRRGGLDVAYEIADWNEPHVTTRPVLAGTTEPTMRISASLLLHEAAVRRDELGRLHELPQCRRIFTSLGSVPSVRSVALVHVDREVVLMSGGADPGSCAEMNVRVAADAMRTWTVNLADEERISGRATVTMEGQRMVFAAPLDWQLVLTATTDTYMDFNRVRQAMADALLQMMPFVARTSRPPELARAIAW